MMNDEDLSSLPRAPREGSIVRCYRYLSGHWEEALKDARLKLSTALEFNDAFDCVGTCVGEFSDGVIRRHLQDSSANIPAEFVRALSGETEASFIRHVYSVGVARSVIERTLFASPRILCFSNPRDMQADALMWSHYGSNWGGVRLGFDLLFENHYRVTYNTTSPYTLTPINYSAKRPVLDLAKIENITDDPLYSRYFYEMLHTKAPCWSYENEWRMFCDEQYSSEDEGLRFWDFNKALLRTVDLGPNIGPDQQDRIVDLCKHGYQHVEIRKVIISQSDYTFEYRTVLSPKDELSAITTFKVNEPMRR